MKKYLFLFLFVFFSINTTISLAEQSNADNSMPSNVVKGDDGNLYYDTNSYNIFTAPLWVIEPYFSFMYAMNIGSVKDRGDINRGGINYSDILDKLNHGFNIGTGIVLNNNYIFGISFNYLVKSKKVRGHPYFDKIKTNIFMLNFDLMLKLPFTFKGLRLYLPTGINVVFANLRHNYTNDMVPVETAQMNDVSFGLNIGFGLEYKIIEHLYLRLDFRRVFLFKSIINDFWLFQTGLTAQF